MKKLMIKYKIAKEVTASVTTLSKDFVQEFRKTINDCVNYYENQDEFRQHSQINTKKRVKKIK